MDMKLEPRVITIGKLAAILGIVQGITWTVLSLTAIILGIVGTWLESPKTYSEYIGTLLYTWYLSKRSPEIRLRISATEFKIFMWIYFVASIFWIGISVDLYIAMVKTKRRYRLTMMLWSALTCAISIVDVVLFGLVLADYETRCYFSQYGTLVEWYSMAVCHTATGVVMTLAARGFTFWAINVILAAVLIKLSRKTLQKRDHFAALQTDYYSLPRVGQPTSQNQAFQNHHYGNEPRPRTEMNREYSQPSTNNYGWTTTAPREENNNYNPYYNN